jgi:hypothetical protein
MDEADTWPRGPAQAANAPPEGWDALPMPAPRNPRPPRPPAEPGPVNPPRSTNRARLPRGANDPTLDEAAGLSTLPEAESGGLFSRAVGRLLRSVGMKSE